LPLHHLPKPSFEVGVPTLSGAVSGTDMEGYLRATHYFRENPENLPHILQSAAAGAIMLA